MPLNTNPKMNPKMNLKAHLDVHPQAALQAKAAIAKENMTEDHTTEKEDTTENHQKDSKKEDQKCHHTTKDKKMAQNIIKENQRDTMEEKDIAKKETNTIKKETKCSLLDLMVKAIKEDMVENTTEDIRNTMDAVDSLSLF